MNSSVYFILPESWLMHLNKSEPGSQAGIDLYFDRCGPYQALHGRVFIPEINWAPTQAVLMTWTKVCHQGYHTFYKSRTRTPDTQYAYRFIDLTTLSQAQMCGISAYFDFSAGRQCVDSPTCNAKHKTEKTLEARLQSSVEQMRHRGPDAQGVWVSQDSTVGLGHVRLGTRDLTAAGDQPFHSTDPEDDIPTVVNGELYDDVNLRESLEYHFQSVSDFEMVIPLYKKYGPAFLSKLRGEFLLILYDGKKREMLVARDRFGVKPLHFEKVPPGHFAILRQYDTTETIRFEPEYPVNEGNSHRQPANQVIDEVKDRLVDSVRMRYESTDVPVGILLSGGVDSSAVAGITAQLARQRIEKMGTAAPPLPTCFTLAFPDDSEFDESAIAARTAKHLSLPLETVVMTEEVLAENFDGACGLGETLLWDLQHVAKKASAKHISSRGFKVVLNGDGGDELFGGYSFFVADRLLDDDRLRASELLEADSSDRATIQRDYQDRWFGSEKSTPQNGDSKTEIVNLPPAFCEMAVSTYNVWMVDEAQSMGSPLAALKETIGEVGLVNMEHQHPMRRSMLAWNKTMPPNVGIAAISDGAEMAHRVESRPPLLDHVLADYTNSPPVDFLVHLEGSQKITEKWVFR